MHQKRQRGFTILELLIVVAIIGLLASILIPNLIDALQKARQKRTLSDVRGIGIAWMSWLTDQRGAASAGANKTYSTAGMGSVGYDDLLNYLRPSESFFYAQEVPQFDSWGFDYKFRMGLVGGKVQNIMICASGRDGVFSECNLPDIPVRAFTSTNYEADIVWADGFFVHFPGQAQ